MTTQYHVFLPPPTLFSLPLPSPISDHSPLHFHDLPAPPRHQTFSQSSLPIQQAKIRPRLSEIGSEQPRALASDEKDSFEASTRMELKRGREEVDALAGGDGELGDQTRRRSRRIARTTGKKRSQVATPKLISTISLAIGHPPPAGEHRILFLTKHDHLGPLPAPTHSSGQRLRLPPPLLEHTTKQARHPPLPRPVSSSLPHSG